MSDSAIQARQQQQLERRVRDIEQRVNQLPSRFAIGGGGSLPPGGLRYELLMTVDDNATVVWSRPRYVVIPA